MALKCSRYEIFLLHVTVKVERGEGVTSLVKPFCGFDAVVMLSFYSCTSVARVHTVYERA